MQYHRQHIDGIARLVAIKAVIPRRILQASRLTDLTVERCTDIGRRGGQIDTGKGIGLGCQNNKSGSAVRREVAMQGDRTGRT